MKNDLNLKAENFVPGLCAEKIAKLSAADVSRNESTIFVKAGKPNIALIDTDLLDLSKR